MTTQVAAFVRAELVITGYRVGYVCRHGRVDGFCDVEAELCFVDPVEGADSGAEEEGGDVERELVDIAAIECLVDTVSAARDAEAFVSCGGFCFSEGRFEAVIYKIEGRIVFLHPGFAFFVGEHIDGGFE